MISKTLRLRIDVSCIQLVCTLQDNAVLREHSALQPALKFKMFTAECSIHAAEGVPLVPQFQQVDYAAVFTAGVLHSAVKMWYLTTLTECRSCRTPLQWNVYEIGAGCHDVLTMH